MVKFQAYQYTSSEDFAKYVQNARLAFLYVYENPNDTSLIEVISSEADELYLAVDISKVAPEIRDRMLLLSPIDQKVYQREKRNPPHIQTFVTGLGFVGTAFEPRDVEALIARSRAEKVNLQKFYIEKLGHDII